MVGFTGNAVPFHPCVRVAHSLDGDACARVPADAQHVKSRDGVLLSMD